jgi:hypothetical protein
MTDPLPGASIGAPHELISLYEDYGTRWQISPVCDGDSGYHLEARPRPPVEDFEPVTADTPAEMRELLTAREARPASDEGARVRADIARQLARDFPGWDVGCDPAGWVARRGHRALWAGSAVALGAKIAAESGQYTRPRLREP